MHTSKTEDEDHESLSTDAEFCSLECESSKDSGW